MERETLRMKHHVRWVNRPIHALLSIYDLPALIGNLENKEMRENHGLTSLILVKQPTRQVVMTSAREGTEIEFFNSSRSFTIQIIAGKAEIRTRYEMVSLGKGQMLTLDENMEYHLTAIEKIVFLLIAIENQNPFMNIASN